MIYLRRENSQETSAIKLTTKGLEFQDKLKKKLPKSKNYSFNSNIKSIFQDNIIQNNKGSFQFDSRNSPSKLPYINQINEKQTQFFQNLQKRKQIVTKQKVYSQSYVEHLVEKHNERKNQQHKLSLEIIKIQKKRYDSLLDEFYGKCLILPTSQFHETKLEIRKRDKLKQLHALKYENTWKKNYIPLANL